MAATLDDQAIEQTLRLQRGVIARRQLLERGATDNDVRRWVRRRDLARVLPGVFVDHTGPPSWSQRAWAGVLHCWPAALWGDSAMQALLGHRWRRATGIVHVAVDDARTLVQPEGYRIHRVAHLGRRVRWRARPPRMEAEDALVALTASATTGEAIAALADACQSGVASAAVLLSHVQRAPYVSKRSWLTAVLSDMAGGSNSSLELAYVRGVERAHGLPTAERQVRDRAGTRWVRRDALYRTYRLCVELDGRHFHDHARARDADLDRDLATALDRIRTIRLGWGQVVDRPCRIAAYLAALLRQGGWSGRLRRCSPACSSREAVRVAGAPER